MPGQHDLLETMFSWGMDVRNRRIVFHGGIELGVDFGQSPIETAIKSLLYLDSIQCPKGIEIWINTGGGDIEEMLGFYDLIKSCQNEVTTIGFGLVASAGCLLLAAGDKRYATENLWFMWHRSETTLIGHSYHEAKSTMTAWARQHKQWCKLMSACSNHTAKFWDNKTRTGELWLSALQLKQHGVVDEVGVPSK